MSYVSECLERFSELPSPTREVFGGEEAFKHLKAIERDFGISLSFALLLVVLGELTVDDVPEYLSEKFKIGAEQAKKAADRLMREIVDPGLDKLLEGDKDMTAMVAYSPEEVEKVFKSGLVPMINDKEENIKSFNLSAFYAIDRDILLEDRLVEALLSNNEVISSVIQTGEYKVAGTVANWIKDFVAQNGSGIFDGLTLARYLSSSPNVSSLSLEEKELLSQVLKTYRNLVFYPDSFQGMPTEDWSLIPFAGTLKEADKKIVEEKKNVMPRAGNNVAADPSIADLQAMLSQYRRDSLEYRAITQEIQSRTKRS